MLSRSVLGSGQHGFDHTLKSTRGHESTDESRLSARISIVIDGRRTSGAISDTYLRHEQEFSRHTFLLCDSLCDFPNPIMTRRAARPLDRSKPHDEQES